MGHYCKLCLKPSIPMGNATVLGKYDVGYYQCSGCGFIQTESPYWLDDAYSNVITSSDIGLVGRNLGCSRITGSLIKVFFDSNSSFLDYGAGYGLFVRLMRDQGYNFYWLDQYASNLFAKNFEAVNGQRFELVTAFELFEHLVDPLVTVEELLTYTDSIFFSTTIVPQPTPALGAWWYYGLEHGQHIALYSVKSLQHIAKKFNLNLYTNHSSLHLLTRKTISPRLFQIVLRGRIASILTFMGQRKSLLADDYHKITGLRLS